MKTNKTTKKVDEAAFKSFNDLDLSKIPGSVTQILTANFDRFNACRTYEDVVALCHELFDKAGLDTDWTRKFFFRLDQIKAENPNPRRAYEKAMLFMNNARMKGMGLGIGRGSRRFGESEDDSKTNESKGTKKQYTKKQIMEAIKHWTNVLKQMNED